MEELLEDNCSQFNLTVLSCFTFNKHHFVSVFWTKIVLAAVATVACSIAIVLIILSKAYKRFVHRLTLYLTTTALVNSIVIALQTAAAKYSCGIVVVRNDALCKASGFLDELSLCMILFLTCWITVHLFILAVFKFNNKSCKSEVAGILTCVALATLFSLVPFINIKNGTMYGLSGAWCWIKLTDENCTEYAEGTIEQFTLWYGPVMSFLVINFFAMLVVVIVLYRDTRRGKLQQKYKQVVKEALPLLIYPVLFNIIYSLAFINRVYYAATKKTSFPLWVAHAIADPCLPLFIPVAFVFHPDTLRKLRAAARHWKQHQYSTHFIVSKPNSCDTERERLVLKGSREIAPQFGSFLNVRSATTCTL